MSPRIDDVRIIPIPLSVDKSIYAAQIPKSYRAPHQEIRTRRYYKRYNFESVPMEDYEINDIRGRRRMLSPLINVDADIKHGVVIYVRVINIGSIPALDVTFEFSERLVWRDGTEPLLLTRGVKYWPPGKTFHFLYHSFQELVSEDRKSPVEFDVTVSYHHPDVGQRISDVFHIDCLDYMNSSVVESEMYQHTQAMKDVLQKLTGEVAKLNKQLESLSSISSPTGLSLSATTLRNVKHLISRNEHFEKIDPEFREYAVFREVLGVSMEMAYRLKTFFDYRQDGQRLADIQGMTPELADRIRQYFVVDPDGDGSMPGGVN
jgi:hypothetical protein